MRIIDLNGYRAIEVWGRRRLYLVAQNGDTEIIPLPSGSLRHARTSRSSTLYLGSTRTTMQILGPTAKIDALADHLINLSGQKERHHL